MRCHYCLARWDHIPLLKRLVITANMDFFHSCKLMCEFCFQQSDRHTERFSCLSTWPVSSPHRHCSQARDQHHSYWRWTGSLSSAEWNRAAFTDPLRNGSLPTHRWIRRHPPFVNLITLSIDSGRPQTSRRLERCELWPHNHFVDLSKQVWSKRLR
jgi:hypothetical protein